MASGEQVRSARLESGGSRHVYNVSKAARPTCSTVTAKHIAYRPGRFYWTGSVGLEHMQQFVNLNYWGHK